MPDDAVATGAQAQLGLGGSYYLANHKTNAAMIFPKQAWSRFHLPHGQSLRIGRFDYADGTELTSEDPSLLAVKRDRLNQRLLGAFNFSQSGRSFDGAHYSAGPERWNVTLLAARPTRGGYQVDGWGELPIEAYYGAFSRRIGRAGEWRVFGLGYTDRRDGVVKVDNRTSAQRGADTGRIEIATYGGHYIQVFERGPVRYDVLLWGVAQNGSWGKLAHRAGAFAIEAGVEPRAAWRPWIRGGYDHASGDRDPLDATHGTFFRVLPSSRTFARTPFFTAMNLNDAFAEVVMRPRRWLTIRSDVHRLRLATERDLWYSGAGASQRWSFGSTGRPSNGERDLAELYDISAEFSPPGPVAYTTYFGHAQGGRVAASLYPNGKNANFGYLELTWRF